MRLAEGRKLFFVLLAIVGLASAGVHAEGYAVRSGDKLAVSVLGKPDLSGTFEVRDNGSIALHLLGPIDVDGSSLAEIERKIMDRAADQFTSRVSVIVSVAEYRSIYVLGAVETPNAYAYKPGITVIQAIALAGGLEKASDDDLQSVHVVEARRRALQAQTQLKFAEAAQAAIAAELQRLAGGEAPAAPPEATEGTDTAQRDLVTLRRTILERSLEGSEQRSSLANEEAGLFAKRRQLIGSQLQATEEQLKNIEGLVSQGLARRDQYLDLQVNADEFRTDELEAAAFEARARQTAVNADNEARVARTRYHQELLADKIAVDRELELARSELQTSLDYLRQAEAAATEGIEGELETIFEIYRSGSGNAPEGADLTTPLEPGDVLNIRQEMVIQ